VIDWLLSQNPRSIRGWSYFIVAGSAAALLGLSKLPHGALNRTIAIVAVIAMTLVLLIWSSFVLTAIMMPRVLEDARRRRSDATTPQAQKGMHNV
jgi:hypothetical protein